jgi:hypothetical protein
VVLLATVNRARPGNEPYTVYAQGIMARLCGGEGLFGRRFTPDQVRVVEVAQPTMRHCVGPAGRVVAEWRPRECLVTSGSGSYALGAGALMAALAADVPTTLVPVDEVSASYRLGELLDSTDRLRDWSLRHRFWDELAELDPEGAAAWRLLAARQRADVAPAVAAVLAGGAPGLSSGQLDKLAELWPTVQAAFFERVARGEAVDHSLLRAWYGQQLAVRLKRESRDLPGRAGTVIAGLVDRLTVGNADGNAGPGAASLIRSARQGLPPQTTGRCAAMLRDERLEDLYRAATTHRAHLDQPGAQMWPLPGTIVEQAEVWESGDLVRKLVGSKGMTAWPVLGSGDVLVLMGVGRPGLNPEIADRQAQEGLRRVIDWAAVRRDALPRRGRVRLRLLASEESAEWARAFAMWVGPSLANVGGEVKVVAPLPVEPGDVPKVREAILSVLESADTPTGLSRSGSLRDVDEIMLVMNPGKPVVNYGMIAAGIDWSLTAACPLRVVELGRNRGVEPIVRDGGRVLRRLGPDPLLARLAASAVRRLDLRTAWRLLSHGSTALDDVRAAVDLLHRDLYADPGLTVGFGERRDLARQRLVLVGHVLADEPWSACYTAVEALRPGLFEWDTRERRAGTDLMPSPREPERPADAAFRWARVKAESAALKELEKWRNASPYAHLLDRLRQDDNKHTGWRTIPPRNVPQLLTRAVNDLRPPAADDPLDERDHALLRRHERLCAELDRLAAAGPGMAASGMASS